MIDPLTASAITGFVSAVISGTILAFMKRKWEKTDKNEEKKDKEDEKKTEDEETIKDIQKSIWRLNKTVLIMAKLIDDQTTKVHSELSASLEDIAGELLGDPDKKS